uniref:Ribonuclease H-like domain-containing protein n=1 Tax=Tanacetum cinerariifolium TaxID=118510 RepID=A0A699IG05_TANCI|nr:ribonuclease H-like domain-containing protein [Tanacetum cinerariifolium]
MMKAQVHVLKSSAISDEQPFLRSKYHCQNDKSIKCDGNDKVISRALRNQDNKHKERKRRNVPMETPTSTALVSYDGLGGYDWKTVKILKSQNEQLSKDLKKFKLMVLGYKTGLESVEDRLKFFKTNEYVYLEDIKVLKVEIQMKDIAIKELRRKLEVAQKEKDGIQLTVEKLENASKSLNKLIDCQIVTTARKVSDDEEENVSQPKIEKKIVKLSIPKIEFVKPRQQDKSARKTVKKVENNRQNTHRPRGNQRNWNNMMSQKLRRNFEMFNKAGYTHPCAKKNMVPRAVLIKSGVVSVNTARQVNAAHPKTTVNVARPMSYLSETVHSTVERSIQKNTSFKNSNVNQRVNTVRSKTVNIARLKAVVNVVQGNKGNPQIDLQDQGVIDSGCSRHMTGNMSYLTDSKEIDRGYVIFEGNLRGGKITGKCTIKTGTLDFKNVYFMRELKFNLFSVSQMCDKKNSVLFNDTECIVLSPNFK